MCLRAPPKSYLYSRDISRHSLNGLTFCHLSVQNYTGFATYAGSTKRPLFLTKWGSFGRKHAAASWFRPKDPREMCAGFIWAKACVGKRTTNCVEKQ
jgi:hypothetical protein